MRFAIIESGVVVNVVIAGSALANNWVQSDIAGIGWFYVDGLFVNPEAAQ